MRISRFHTYTALLIFTLFASLISVLTKDVSGALLAPEVNLSPATPVINQHVAVEAVVTVGSG